MRRGVAVKDEGQRKIKSLRFVTDNQDNKNK
jgi:hypothetical protein